MLYKPKYCCSCGEKVERTEWRVWTSRRFCQVCETEYVPHEIIPKAVVGFGIVLGIFGFSSFFSTRDNNKAVGFSSSKESRLVGGDSEYRQQPAKAVVPQQETQMREALPANPTSLGSVPPGQIVLEQPESKLSAEKAVFYCGAPTRKGTPCTRRVKVKGYCWQHKGQA
ncbi:MAG: hypothetical protein ACT4O9_13375, partial [Blastocatellia bacterium]